MMKANEIKCCDAAIKYLEIAKLGERSNLCFPENIGSTPYDLQIEILFSINNVEYAMEHTLVEPFAHYRRGGVLSRKLEDALRKTLSEDDFYFLDILIPTDWHKSFLTVKARNSFAEELAGVLTQIAKINDSTPMQPDETWRSIGEVSGIEILIQFRLNDFELGGLTVTQVSSHVQSDRTNRIRTALEKKLPKLQAYNKKGAKTILLLENNDISLTNWYRVEESIISSWNNYPDGIDYLFYVSACHSIWYLHPLVEDGKRNSREVGGRANFTKFLESDLATAL